MAATTGSCMARFMDSETKKCSLLSSPVFSRQCAHFPIQRYQFCSLSMNGCEGDPRAPPIGTIETRTFPAVPTPALAMERLNSTISDMKSNPPPYDSGIIRLEVAVQQKIEAIDWLHSQQQHLLPRCFFSGRSPTINSDVSYVDHTNGNGHSYTSSPEHRLISVAGIGSAVFFRHVHPFSFDHWRAIKRFLSKKCPLIRAYGAIRFDARSGIAPEWEPFGSFYFMVPQILNDRLSLMNLKEVQLFLRPSHGTMAFHGHMEKQ